jgi:hypothetical protein
VADLVARVNIRNVAYQIRVSRNETQKKTMPIIPKPYEVYIRRISVIYVPLWSVDFQGNNVTYTRRVLGSLKKGLGGFMRR